MRFPVTCAVSIKWALFTWSAAAWRPRFPLITQQQSEAPLCNWACNWTWSGVTIRGVTNSVSPTHTHTHPPTHARRRRWFGSRRPTEEVRETLVTQSNMPKTTRGGIQTADRNTPTREKIQGPSFGSGARLSLCMYAHARARHTWIAVIYHRQWKVGPCRGKCVHGTSGVTQWGQVKMQSTHTHTHTELLRTCRER